jgi:Zn-finger nucleic acid-binding protein
MERVRTKKATVDRCKTCKGLWFDMLEHKDIKGKEAAQELDVGDAKTGKAFNKQVDVKCPLDGQRMTRMTALGQPHIHYEQCPTCHGVFFDAGEFRDFQTTSIGDMVKSLFAREKL